MQYEIAFTHADGSPGLTTAHVRTYADDRARRRAGGRRLADLARLAAEGVPDLPFEPVAYLPEVDALADHLANHDWMGELGRMREVYREKCAVMLESLDEIMPAEATWNRPRGGFYIWVKLPERYNAYELDMLALDRGVGFVPGTSFYLDGRGTHEFRLSYCLPTIENIREGMRRLGAVFAEYDAAHDGAPQND